MTTHPDELAVDRWREQRPAWCDEARWDGFLLAAHMSVVRDPAGAARDLASAKAELEHLRAEAEG